MFNHFESSFQISLLHVGIPIFIRDMPRRFMTSEPKFVNVSGSPGINSKESIPPVYGGPVRQIGFSYRSARLGIDSWAP